jgi:hypothetical protein
MNKRTQIQKNLARAIGEGTALPVYFGHLSKRKCLQINALRVENGLLPISDLGIYIYPSVLNKMQIKRIGTDKLTAEQIADIAYSALHNTRSRIFPSKNPLAQLLWQVREQTSYVVFLGGYNNAFSIKSIFPTFTEKVLRKFVHNKKNT